jgi:hypothetical protein
VLPGAQTATEQTVLLGSEPADAVAFPGAEAADAGRAVVLAAGKSAAE